MFLIVNFEEKKLARKKGLSFQLHTTMINLESIVNLLTMILFQNLANKCHWQ